MSPLFGFLHAVLLTSSLLSLVRARSFGVNKAFHHLRPGLPTTIYTQDPLTNPLIDIPLQSLDRLDRPSHMIEHTTPRPVSGVAGCWSEVISDSLYRPGEAAVPLMPWPDKWTWMPRGMSLLSRQFEPTPTFHPVISGPFGSTKVVTEPASSSATTQTTSMSDTTIALVILFGLLIAGVVLWALVTWRRRREKKTPIIRRLDIELASPVESDATLTKEAEKRIWTSPPEAVSPPQRRIAAQGYPSPFFTQRNNGFLQVPPATPHGGFFQSLRGNKGVNRRRNGVISPHPNLPRPRRAVLEEARTPESPVSRRSSRASLSSLKLAAIVEDKEDESEGLPEPAVMSSISPPGSEQEILASSHISEAVPSSSSTPVRQPPTDSLPSHTVASSVDHVEFPSPTHRFATHRVKAKSIAGFDAGDPNSAATRRTKALSLQSPMQIKGLRREAVPLAEIGIRNGVNTRPVPKTEKCKRDSHGEPVESLAVFRTNGKSCRPLHDTPTAGENLQRRSPDTPGTGPTSPLQAFFDELAISRSPDSNRWRESMQSALSNHSQESDLSSPSRPESLGLRYSDILASCGELHGDSVPLEEFAHLTLAEEPGFASDDSLKFSSRLSLDSVPSFGSIKLDRNSVASFGSGMTFDKVYEELLAGYVEELAPHAMPDRNNWADVPNIMVTEH